MFRGLCHPQKKAVTVNPLATALINSIIEELNKRFCNSENNAFLAEATFLDPRFKKNGFKSNCFHKSKGNNPAAATAMQAQDDNGTAVEYLQSLPNTNSDDENLIWGDFDRCVSAVVVTLTSSAPMEIRQYFEEVISQEWTTHKNGGEGILAFNPNCHSWLGKNCV